MEIKKHYYSKCPDIIIQLHRDGQIANKIYGTSAAIQNASDVFNRMLDSDNGFRALPTEADLGNQRRVLSLLDDDAEAMLIILKVIHYQTKSISETLSHQLLVELPVACDKYDCARILHPWLDTWVSSLINAKDYNFSEFGQEYWLLIGHVFPAAKGVGTLVRELLAQLAKKCYSPDRSEFRRYLRSNSDSFSDELHGRTIKLRFAPDRSVDHILEESESGKKNDRGKNQKFCAELGLY